MCVIAASENTLMNKDQVVAGFKENPYGAGVAWIDKDKAGPLVRWKKGIMNPDEVWDIVKDIKPGTPYVVHFRIPTEGLDDIEGTHPFPIDDAASTAFEGTTRGSVLFHNGSWSVWRTMTLDTCTKKGVRLPKGMLTDSRMMAWAAHHYGEEVLQLINEKAVVLGINEDGTTHFQMYGENKTNNWTFKGDREKFDENGSPVGIWFSNDRWEKHMPKAPYTQITHLRDIKRIVGGSGGDRHQGTFRTANQQHRNGGSSVSGRSVEQEEMESRETPPVTGPGTDGKLATSPVFRAQMAKVHPESDDLAWAMQYNPKKFNRRVAGFVASANHQVH